VNVGRQKVSYLLLFLMWVFVLYAKKQVGKLPLAEKYLYNTELLWTKQFNGRLSSIKIANKSGNIIIAVVIDKSKSGYVYYFDPQGNLLWKLSHKENTKLNYVKEIELQISNDGELVVIDWWGDHERCETQVYNKEGMPLFMERTKVGGSTFQLSPEGNYIYRGSNIWSRSGAPIDFNIDGINSRFMMDIQFISDEEIIVKTPMMSRKEIYKRMRERDKTFHIEYRHFIVSFPDGKIKEELPLKAKIQKIRNYTLLTTQSEKGKICLFLYDENKNQIWRKEDIKIDSSFLFSTEKQIGILSTDGLYIIDCKSGKILTHKEKNLFIRGFCPLYAFFDYDDKIILSGKYSYAYFPDGTKPSAENYFYILKLDKKWNIVEESFERGLIIGASNSEIIGIYYSDSEKKPERGPLKCKNFWINVLKKKIK